MSLGFGRGLLAVACVVAVTGRVVAQTPPAQPPRTPAPQQPNLAPAQQAPAPAQPSVAPAPPERPTAPAAAGPGPQTPTETPVSPVPGEQTKPTPAIAAGTDTTAATVAEGAEALPKAEPTPEAVERARAAYARGQQAFAGEDFASALQAFEEAYANVANPIVLVSIGESAAKLDRIETAIAAYDAYLRERPDAPDRDEVAQKRAALAAGQAPARLALTSEPAGADVILDGQLVGRVTPVVLEVRPGAHRVSLVLLGYETARVTAELPPGGSAQRAVTLEPSPASEIAQVAPPVEALPEPPPLIKPEPPHAAIFVTAGLGAAGLIAGSVLGIFALKERSDFNTNPTEAGADRGERLALFSDVGFGIGAMSLITTAVLLFTHDPPRPAEDRESARFELVPSFTTRSASASAKVRF